MTPTVLPFQRCTRQMYITNAIGGLKGFPLVLYSGPWRLEDKFPSSIHHPPSIISNQHLPTPSSSEWMRKRIPKRVHSTTTNSTTEWLCLFEQGQHREQNEAHAVQQLQRLAMQNMAMAMSKCFLHLFICISRKVLRFVMMLVMCSYRYSTSSSLKTSARTGTCASSGSSVLSTCVANMRRSGVASAARSSRGWASFGS